MKHASLPLLRRREFITALGGAAAWPLRVGAQPMALVGFLDTVPRSRRISTRLISAL